MPRRAYKVAAGVVLVLLLLVIGLAAYVAAFTSHSLRLSSPLQSLSGFTHPLRNLVAGTADKLRGWFCTRAVFGRVAALQRAARRVKTHAAR